MDYVNGTGVGIRLVCYISKVKVVSDMFPSQVTHKQGGSVTEAVKTLLYVATLDRILISDHCSSADFCPNFSEPTEKPSCEVACST